MKNITLAAGGGGKAMNELIGGLILKYFKSDELKNMRDASYIAAPAKAAFSTDSFVITPEIFPGGDIGKLAVAGTTNDLACSGAKPLYLSCALVIPEGFSFEKLETIIASMAKAADECGVEIITGDTKVVPKGELSGLIINTSGIGEVQAEWNRFENVKPGDKIIITSDIARHGISVLLARKELGFKGTIESDCNILNNMLSKVKHKNIHFVRDATRGGVAAVLNELSTATGLGVYLQEDSIPIREDVSHLCDMLGFDPLAVANEGALVMVCAENDAEEILQLIKSHPYGERAALCGHIQTDRGVILETSIGGKRYVEMPLGEILPRIC